MSRIPAIFADLRARNAKALMPFICGGHPLLPNATRSTTDLLPAIARAGGSIVEVGIPFSDPIADGPVIAAAMHETLQRGTTPESVFQQIAAARAGPGLGQLGIVAMMSISLLWRMGIGRTIALAAASGIDGFIFPDAPLEEAEPLLNPLREAGLTASLLIAPTTPPARAQRIVDASSGFVYLLARAGITGDSASGAGPTSAPDVGAAIAPRIALLRTMTDLPIACGFGIATPAHVRSVVHGGNADAAIVGSALVRRLAAAAAGGHDVPGEAEAFVRDLATGLDR